MFDVGSLVSLFAGVSTGVNRYDLHISSVPTLACFAVLFTVFTIVSCMYDCYALAAFVIICLKSN